MLEGNASGGSGPQTTNKSDAKPGLMSKMFENERYLSWVENILNKATMCGGDGDPNSTRQRFASCLSNPNPGPRRPVPRNRSINSTTVRCQTQRVQPQHNIAYTFTDEESGLFQTSSKDNIPPAPVPPTDATPLGVFKGFYSSSPIGTLHTNTVHRIERKPSSKANEIIAQPPVDIYPRLNKASKSFRSNSSKSQDWDQTRSRNIKRGDLNKGHYQTPVQSSYVASDAWDSPVNVADILVPTAAEAESLRKAKELDTEQATEKVNDCAENKTCWSASSVSTERLVQKLKFDSKPKKRVDDSISVGGSAASSVMTTTTRELICIAPDGKESLHIQEESEKFDGIEFVTSPGLTVRRLRDGELEEAKFTESGYSSAGSEASF